MNKTTITVGSNWMGWLCAALVVLKLLGKIPISWWWVFAPVWVPAVIVLLILLVMGIILILGHMYDGIA